MNYHCLPDPSKTLVPAVYLSPCTEPDAIKAAQRKAIREAHKALKERGELVSVESLSLEAILPVSIIRSRLREMKSKVLV